MSFFKNIGQFLKSAASKFVSLFKRSSSSPAQPGATQSAQPAPIPAPIPPPNQEAARNRFFMADNPPIPAQTRALNYANNLARRVFNKVRPWVQRGVDRWREREALRATETIIQPAFFQEQQLKFEVAVHRAQVEFAEAFIASSSKTLSATKQNELVRQYHTALEEISADLLDNYKRNLSLDVRPHIIRDGKKVTLTQAMQTEILHNYELSLQRSMRPYVSFRILTLREAHFTKGVLTKRIQSLDDRQYELFQQREAARMKMYDRDEEAAGIVAIGAEQAAKGLSFFINQFKDPLHLLGRRHYLHRISPDIIKSTKEKLENIRNRRNIRAR